MKFFCTAGRGTEIFLAQEIHETWKNTPTRVTDGKVYFELLTDTSDLSRVKTLKAAERVFVQVVQTDLKSQDRHGLLRTLRQELLQKDLLQDCLQTWRAAAGRCCDTSDYETDGSKGSAPAPKRVKLDTNVEGVSFRVSCKLSGSARRHLNPQMTSRQMGVAVARMTGWRVELRHPAVEICIHVSDTCLTIGIPVTSLPLSKRSFVRHCGLRAPVAWIMARLLDTQTGDLVVDPMCGKATVLLEASHSVRDAVYIGSDRDSRQLQLARENVQFAGAVTAQVHLLQASCTDLPYASGTVDRVVTDAPFGQKFTTSIDLKQFYLEFLQEFDRILKPGGSIILLTSPELKSYLEEKLSKEETPGSEQLDTKINGTVHHVCSENIVSREMSSSDFSSPAVCEETEERSGGDGDRNPGDSYCHSSVCSLRPGAVSSISVPEGTVACSTVDGKRNIVCKFSEEETSGNALCSEAPQPSTGDDGGGGDGKSVSVFDENSSREPSASSMSSGKSRTQEHGPVLHQDSQWEEKHSLPTERTSSQEASKECSRERISRDLLECNNETAEPSGTQEEMNLSETAGSQTNSSPVTGGESAPLFQNLVLLQSHYLKLGETHAYVCSIKKRK